MEAGRRHETPGSETRGFITRGSASSNNIMSVPVVFAPHSSPVRSVQRAQVDVMQAVDLCRSWGTLSLDNHFLYSKPAFCPGRRYYFIPQGCSLKTQPWEMSRDGVAFLAYPVSMHRDTQGPWWIASLNSIFIPLYVQLDWIEFSTCQEI